MDLRTELDECAKYLYRQNARVTIYFIINENL